MQLLPVTVIAVVIGLAIGLLARLQPLHFRLPQSGHALQHIVHELRGSLTGAGHLAGQHTVGVARVAQAASGLVSQRQQLVKQRAVLGGALLAFCPEHFLACCGACAAHNWLIHLREKKSGV